MATPAGARPPRAPFYRRFGVRLCLLLLLVGLPALGLTIYGSFRERGLEKARLSQGALAVARLAAANQENFIRNTRQLFDTLAQFPFLLLATNRPFTQNTLGNLKRLLPDYSSFGLIETNGSLFAGSEPMAKGVYLGDRRYFQQVLLTRQFSIGEFQISRLSGEATLNFGYPVSSERGRLDRVLYASLRISRIGQALQGIRLPAGEVLTVLDQAGTVLARQPASGPGAGWPHPEGRLLTSGRADADGLFETKGPDGVPRLYAVQPVGGERSPAMWVCVEVPLSVLFAQANRALYGQLLVLLLVAGALCLAVQLYARHSFLLPIRRLNAAAERLAQGELETRAGTPGGAAELVHLGRTLDAMAGKVQARTTELVQSNQALQAQILEREHAQQELRRQEEEKRKLEEQVLRSQRMDSLGALAGGIAHDLNNALVPVLMGVELLQEQGGEEQQPVLELIASSGRRCTALVKQILTFAKGSRGQSGSVPARHLVEEMAALARSTFRKNIQLETRIAKDLWSVSGNATELHQVLLNLCVNARDAMPNGGRLGLTAENAVLGEEWRSRRPGAVPGPHVVLTISDTGCGIAPELQARVFEPFFTTKAPDKGTGLGLSTVSSIVQRHHGFLDLKSEPGRGTEFKVYLPAASSETAEKAEAPAAALPGGAGEVVLLADDESSVLELGRSALENYGYRPLTASNGLEALACFELHRHEIKLVIVDTDMPYLDGLSALRRIRESAPGLPVILASATTQSPERLAELKLAGVLTLAKPYGVEELLRQAAAALGKA